METATGGIGVAGCSSITATAELAEVHPEASETVKLWEPGLRPVTVKLFPVPDCAMEPGKRRSVQLPAGNPFSFTLPVAITQVGCVMVPSCGAPGAGGAS